MAVNKEDKDKSLDKVLSVIEKQFGKGSIMKLGDNKHLKVDVVSSGCLSLDIALGVGGYPKVELLRFMDLNQVVKLHLHYRRLLNIKN